MRKPWAERSACNKGSEVAFIGADWGADVYPSPIIGFIGSYKISVLQKSILNWSDIIQLKITH